MTDTTNTAAQATTEGAETQGATTTETDTTTTDTDTGEGGEKKADDKGADDKTDADADGDKGDEGAPESYDLKAPDDTKLRTADIERIEAEARELGLTNEEAQEYLETQAKAVAAYHDSLLKDFETERDSWVKVSKEKYSAEDVEQAARLIKTVAEKSGNNDFYAKVLAPKSEGGMGYGDNPDIIGMFVYMAKQGFADDKLEHGVGAGTGTQSLEKRLYKDLK